MKLSLTKIKLCNSSTGYFEITITILLYIPIYHRKNMEIEEKRMIKKKARRKRMRNRRIGKKTKKGNMREKGIKGDRGKQKKK